MAAGEGDWIPTERTSPALRGVLVNSAIATIAIAALAGYAAISKLGLLSTIGLIALICVVNSGYVWFVWNLRRPAAIRVNFAGVEVRKMSGGVVRIPKENVRITRVGTSGFGLIALSPPNTAYLSPLQFAAINAYFPTVGSGPGQGGSALQ